MTIHRYDGELGNVLSDMREHINQALARQMAGTPMTVEIRFAEPLLKHVSQSSISSQVYGLESYLGRLENVLYRLKRNPRATRHELEITRTDQQEKKSMSQSNKLPDWVNKIFNKLGNSMLTNEEAHKQENRQATEEDMAPNTDQSQGQGGPASASRPNKPASGVHANNKYPLVSEAIASVVAYIVDCASQINEYVDANSGKKRLIVDRVRFTPLSPEAEHEYRACFKLRNNTATWSGMLKQLVRTENEQVTRYLNLDSPRFELLALQTQDNDGCDELQDFHAGARTQAFEIAIELREEAYQEPVSPSPSSSATSAGTIELEIRDARHPVLPQTENLSRERFNLGVNGDIRVDGEHCSGKHLEFYRDAQGWFVLDKSTNGTVLNGKVMTKGVAVAVKAGDVFRLATRSAQNLAGDYDKHPEVRIKRTAGYRKTPVIPVENRDKPSAIPTPVSPENVKPSAIATKIDLAAARIGLFSAGSWQIKPLAKLPAMLGRDENGDIVVDGALHDRVSRQHLQIESINDHDITILVCEACFHGVHVNGLPLEKGKRHNVAFEQELFLAPESMPGHLRIRFLKGPG